MERPKQLDVPDFKEQLLANESFRRFSAGLDLYQELLREAQNEEKRAEILGRMHELYRPTLNPAEMPASETFPLLQAILRSTLESCERGTFTPEGFAEAFSSQPLLAKGLLDRWNPQPGEVNGENETIMVNEIINYQVTSDQEITINIAKGNVPGEGLLVKIKEGFALLANRLDNGQVPAERVHMRSWLLGPRYIRLIERVLGSVEPQTVDHEENFEEFEAAQVLALQFNARVLNRYLINGEKPEIREVQMSREEFIERFKK